METAYWLLVSVTTHVLSKKEVRKWEGGHEGRCLTKFPGQRIRIYTINRKELAHPRKRSHRVRYAGVTERLPYWY